MHVANGRRRPLSVERLESRFCLTTLVDVTAYANLDQHEYGGPTRHSLGVVWVDVNNDGLSDIFATNGYSPDGQLTPHLYLNDGVGGFVHADELLPALPNYEYVGARAADYDRDGDQDLFLYTAHEQFSLFGIHSNPYDGPPNLLLKNQLVENGQAGPGQFVDVAATAGLDDCPTHLPELFGPGTTYGCYQTRSAAFLDYDLDGWIDLYVGHMVVNRVGSVSDPKADELGRIANMDVIYRNAGDGTFVAQTDVLRAGDATNRSALVAVAGQLNDDMWPDVYVGNIGKDSVEMTAEDYGDALLINDGQGHLELESHMLGHDSPAAMGIDFGDVNLDGDYDVYVTDVRDHWLNGPSNIGNTLYLSQRGGFAENSANSFGIDFDLSWGTNFVDFDLDGREELFVGSGTFLRDSAVFSFNQPVATNASVGRVRPATEAILNTTNVRGSAIADYDQDGDPDLLLVNHDGKLQLFQNQADATEMGSLVVELKPTTSNWDAIGAKVELVTKQGRRMIRQIKGGTSFQSQDANEIYFGLGGNEIDHVTVRWPHTNGAVQKITNVSPGRLVVEEPVAVTLVENFPKRSHPSSSSITVVSAGAADFHAVEARSAPARDMALTHLSEARPNRGAIVDEFMEQMSCGSSPTDGLELNGLRLDLPAVERLSGR